MNIEVFTIDAEFMAQQHIMVKAPDLSPVSPVGSSRPASQGQWYALSAVDTKPHWSRMIPGAPEFLVPILKLELHDDWYRRTAAMFAMGLELMEHYPEPQQLQRPVEKFWLWLHRQRDPKAPVFVAVAMRVPRRG